MTWCRQALTRHDRRPYSWQPVRREIVVPLSPPPNDPDCPSCRKPIKHGTPDVLKGGQTLHLRCWTLMLRGRMSALDRNRIARVGARDRQFHAPGEAEPRVPPGATPGPA
jgi:hypothetical protein